MLTVAIAQFIVLCEYCTEIVS